MSDVTVTAGSVLVSTNAQTTTYNAGATITAGQLVYVASDGDVEPAQANAASTDAIAGVALNGAAAGQPVKVQFAGRYTVGGTVAVGVYVLSAAAAGGIAPEADLTTGNYLSVFGSAISTSVIEINIHNTGVTHA